ncbi:MAG: hypothetical protein IJW82_06905 [Clostridia bacterium]|nr:hypothetical protein [Clostridia bacterium]
MRITKPKENQLLIEDDCLKEYKLDVESKTGLNETIYNRFYEGMILAYRLPNMDASKQMFYGSPASIMTLMCSSIENLLVNKLVSEDQLDEIIKEIKKSAKARKGK